MVEDVVALLLFLEQLKEMGQNVILQSILEHK